MPLQSLKLSQILKLIKTAVNLNFYLFHISVILLKNPAAEQIRRGAGRHCRLKTTEKDRINFSRQKQ